jgi:hypothetical protein
MNLLLPKAAGKNASAEKQIQQHLSMFKNRQIVYTDSYKYPVEMSQQSNFMLNVVLH